MDDLDLVETSSFREEMIEITDRLPLPEEHRRVRRLIIQHGSNPPITDDELSTALDTCCNLESADFSGIPDVTDKSIVVLSERATNLQSINLTGCGQITDVGVLELTSKSLPLQTIQLNGVTGITDPSISAIAKACSRLVDLELCNLPLVSPLSMRDVWSYSR